MGPKGAMATIIIGKGFKTWKNFLPDPNSSLTRLYKMTKSNDPLVSRTSKKTLLLIGQLDPKLFLTVLGAIVLNSQYSIKERKNAIRLITELLKKGPVTLYNHLVLLANILVKFLDPENPNTRKQFLNVVTRALEIAVKEFPMINFHQDSQRLAVGMENGGISIYDLRTTTIVQQLDKHKKRINALCFSKNGKFLASFSAQESIVHVFQTSSSFFWFARRIREMYKNFSFGNWLESFDEKGERPVFI